MDETGMRIVMSKFASRLEGGMADIVDGLMDGLKGDIKELVKAQHAANIARLAAARIREGRRADVTGCAVQDYEKILSSLEKKDG